MSNLVRRITTAYVALLACSIAAFGAILTVSTQHVAASERDLLFCVLVPHFKDEYWLSVGYGLEQEATAQNIELVFFEAGGYRSRVQQISQLSSCKDIGADAILIGAVTSDHPDLLQAINNLSTEVPVFGLVNELHSQSLSGHVGVDWRDMGIALGQFLARQHPIGTEVKTAVLISGPSIAGWTGPLEQGLRRGLSESAIEIIEVFGADTGLRQQLRQVEAALGEFPEVDYLIGSAPAVEATIGLLSGPGHSKSPALVSTYVNHTIKRGLMNGRVLAAPFDDPMFQGTMAIKQALSVLNSGQVEGARGPEINLLSRFDSDLEATRVSPAEYFPKLQ